MSTLVVGRKVGEMVRINKDITVSLISIGKGQVKLAISAPSGISVDREEIHIRKMASAAA